MKKYSLLFSLIFICICNIFISCADNSNIDEINVSEQFQLLPTRSTDIIVYSNSTQLFNNTKYLNTRGCDMNSNMWDDMPTIPSNDEITNVLNYIASKPESVKWPGYTTFYIQQIGGNNHIYSYVDFNGASHSMNGTTSMEQLSIVEADGTYLHVNNFNAGSNNNNASNYATKMTNGFKAATALNEYSSTMIENWKIYYYNNNYYLGLDYYCTKNDAKTSPAVATDGCYDDWVVKIIPSHEPVKSPEYENTNPDSGNEPSTNPDDTKEEVSNNGNVEVNLSINAEKESDDYIFTKTSIHVRDTVDFNMFIPVTADYYCEADDMYIVQKHYDYMVYNSKTEEVEMNINNNIVKLTVIYSAEGITIKSDGINKEVLKYCREYYNDGLTFEIYNYYNNTLNRTELHKLLDNSYIIFSDTPHEFINTKLIDLDCTVVKK